MSERRLSRWTSGFDTHDRQTGTHEFLLKELDIAIGNFFANLLPLSERTLLFSSSVNLAAEYRKMSPAPTMELRDS